MIRGLITDEGVPEISIDLGGDTWSATIDTGFNGELELPETVRALVNAKFLCRGRSYLAGNVSIDEDVFLVEFPFDGNTVIAEATFVSAEQILIGTELMRDYRLEIHFRNRTVLLD